MRNRRPELFSDSELVEETNISKEFLSFYLDRITERKDEINFESFCRLLAEKEICPNLLPQTGPIGGGDSKVDSETYPVAKEISDFWYEGTESQQAATERWAFAFSAKREWKGKIDSDVQKIINTNRGYAKIFFISNQAISDKERAKKEDELRNKYSVDIRIFDRTWIVEKIFKNKRFDIIQKSFNTDLTNILPKLKEGPKDFNRRYELEELDLKLSEPSNYIGDYQLTEDCLYTALLARGLARPRAEVDGRFDRAERMARKMGYKPILFEVIYSRTWTDVWWYEDFSQLLDRYNELERIALSTNEISTLESLNNILWLRYAGQNVWTESEIKQFDLHTKKLRQRLSEIVKDKNRPNASLRAGILLALMSLKETKSSDQKKAFNNFTKLIKKSKGHIDFPLEYLVNILTDLCHIFSNNQYFKKAIDTAIYVWGEKVKEGEQGKLWLNRAIQLSSSGSPYAAIDEFTRAQKLLQHYEYKTHLAISYAGIAASYQNVGLLWAARANYIISLNILMDMFDDAEHIRVKATDVIYRLIWIEIQLGRIAHCIDLVFLYNGMSTSLSKENLISFDEKHANIDTVLALLLLKIPYEELPLLSNLPKALEEAGLYWTQNFLLYLLGHPTELPDVINDTEFSRLFSLGFEQPAFQQLPDRAELYSKSKSEISFIILGCRVNILFENSRNGILVSETIASSIESMFSNFILHEKTLSTMQNIFIDVELIKSEQPEFHVEMIDNDDNIEQISLKCSTASIEYSKMIFFEDEIKKLMGFVFLELQISFINKKQLNSVYTEESHDRFFSSLRASLHYTNIFSNDFVYKLSDIKPKSEKFYAVLRDINSFKNIKPKSPDISQSEPKIITNPTKDDLKQFIKGIPQHNDFLVVSPINSKWWDRAKWVGVAAGAIKNPDGLIPIISLIFENMPAADRIFMAWRNQIGKIDINNNISITIVTDLKNSNQMSYKFCISSNIRDIKTPKKGVKYILGSRTKLIDEASNSSTLDFIKRIHLHKSPYLLTYVGAETFSKKVQPSMPEIEARGRTETVIIKKDLSIIPEEDFTFTF